MTPAGSRRHSVRRIKHCLANAAAVPTWPQRVPNAFRHLRIFDQITFSVSVAVFVCSTPFGI